MQASKNFSGQSEFFKGCEEIFRGSALFKRDFTYFVPKFHIKIFFSFENRIGTFDIHFTSVA